VTFSFATGEFKFSVSNNGNNAIGGLSAGTIMFTVDTADPSRPGFSLTGNFAVSPINTSITVEQSVVLGLGISPLAANSITRMDLNLIDVSVSSSTSASVFSNLELCPVPAGSSCGGIQLERTFSNGVLVENVLSGSGALPASSTGSYTGVTEIGMHADGPASGASLRSWSFHVVTSDLPLTPTGLHAVVGNQRVYLYWNPPRQAVDSYNVSRNDGNSVTILSVCGFCNTISDFGLVNGQLYTYAVTAVKNGTESSPSISIAARPEALAPPPHPPYRILFLHGIFSDAATWDSTGDFLQNTLGWTAGGTLSYQCTDDPRTTFPLVSARFHSQADFFTVNFGDNMADYGNVIQNPLYPLQGPLFFGCSQLVGTPGLLHQADEVQGFIRRLRASGNTGKIDVVAHSMGGLAARSYIANTPGEAVQRVSKFVTYGTPHWGVSPGNVLDAFSVLAILSGVNPFVTSRGAQDLRVDCAKGILGGPLDYSQEPAPGFLEQLRRTTLPAQVQYFVIRGHNDISHQFLTSCLSHHWDGLITMDSADLGRIPANAPAGQAPLTTNTVPLLTTNRLHTTETADVSSILCSLGLNCFVITVHSPVDVEITGPDGRSLAQALSEIPGASYMELADETGHEIATALVPFPLAGEYRLRVIPKATAAPTDTYTLEIVRAGVTTLLAQDQKIQDIPAEPYLVTVFPPIRIDIKPGSPTNPINLQSSGTIPVAIMSSPTFDAPSQVGVSSLTFGRTGTELSLAFCNQDGEDVNGDGLLDLVCHFNAPKTDFTVGDTQGVLKGKTLAEVPFVGTGPVRITR
jgi:pimeloyl-ACP methyl ester carboxylesterase